MMDSAFGVIQTSLVEDIQRNGDSGGDGGRSKRGVGKGR
jgi:hypothetical protein